MCPSRARHLRENVLTRSRFRTRYLYSNIQNGYVRTHA